MRGAEETARALTGARDAVAVLRRVGTHERSGTGVAFSYGGGRSSGYGRFAAAGIGADQSGTADG